MAKHNILGKIGEQIAVKFLENKGFVIIETNYRKKWGEIDIIAKKDSVIHFVEVKSVSCESSDFSPEDNMHLKKRQRLSRAVQTYLMEKNSREDFQIDLASVYLNISTKRAKIDILENIELA